MKLAPLGSILVTDRQRQRHDPSTHEELKASICERRAGLLHAPVLRAGGDATHPWILVAGGRRLRAIEDIYALGQTFRHDGVDVPPGQVPFVELGDLSPIEAFEAELEENIRRDDLTVQERAKGTADLMELRRLQAERDGRPPPKIADISVEVRGSADGGYHENTRRELVIAQHLADPDVAKATSLGEAYKIVKKKAAAKRHEELAFSVGRTFTKAAHSLLNEDALVWMNEAKDETFDVICTDPPYGMGADAFGDSGVGISAEAHSYEDSYENWLEIMRVFPQQVWRLAKPAAHAYIFCDFDRFAELRLLMSAAGWTVFRTPLVWYNLDGFRAPWPQSGPQRKYELILYAKKGDRQVNKLAADVLVFAKDAALGHPAQKPVALIRELLARSAQPGDRVLDPFGGSGAVVAAAHELKLSCTMLEMDPRAYGVAVKRLEGLT